MDGPPIIPVKILSFDAEGRAVIQDGGGEPADAYTPPTQTRAFQRRRSTFRRLVGLFFSARGRLNRKGFWFVCSFGVPAMMLLDHIMVPIAANSAPRIDWFSFPLLLIFIVWTDLALIVKRLHDLGITGWAFLPIAGVLAYFHGSPLLLLPAILLGTFPGTSQENKYGLPYRALIPPDQTD